MRNLSEIIEARSIRCERLNAIGRMMKVNILEILVWKGIKQRILGVFGDVEFIRVAGISWRVV